MLRFLNPFANREKSVQQLIQSKTFDGPLYEYKRQVSKTIMEKAVIKFEKESQGQYSISFQDSTNSEKEYAFPVHQQMNIITSTFNSNQKQYISMKWYMDEEKGSRIGCALQCNDYQVFIEILSKILNQQIRNLTSFQLQETDFSVDQEPKVQTRQNAPKQCTECGKMQKKVKNKWETLADKCLLLINKTKECQFQLVILDLNQRVLFQNDLFALVDKKLKDIYNWFDVQTGVQYQVHFKNNKAFQDFFLKKEELKKLSSKSLIKTQYKYEITTRNSVKNNIKVQQEEQTTIVNEVYRSETEPVLSKKIVSTLKANQQTKNYKFLVQSKSSELYLASFGSSAEIIKIYDGGIIKKAKQIEFGPVNVVDAILFKEDQQALLKDNIGNVHIFDVEKGVMSRSKIVKQCLPIVSVCPNYKFAQLKENNLFKAVSNDFIIQIDVREPSGIGSFKNYQTKTDFSHIISGKNSDEFACGSSNGKYRLYREIGKNASNMFDGPQHRIIHMETSKNSELLLITYPTCVLLCHTNNLKGTSMYATRADKNNRPDPIELRIRPQHASKKPIRMLAARFNESLTQKQSLIIGGFSTNIIIWKVKDALNNITDYQIQKIGSETLLDSQFVFDDKNHVITTTSETISINKI